MSVSPQIAIAGSSLVQGPTAGASAADEAPLARAVPAEGTCQGAVTAGKAPIGLQIPDAAAVQLGTPAAALASCFKFQMGASRHWRGALHNVTQQ